MTGKPVLTMAVIVLALPAADVLAYSTLRSAARSFLLGISGLFTSEIQMMSTPRNSLRSQRRQLIVEAMQDRVPRAKKVFFLILLATTCVQLFPRDDYITQGSPVSFTGY